MENLILCILILIAVLKSTIGEDITKVKYAQVGNTVMFMHPNKNYGNSKPYIYWNFENEPDLASFNSYGRSQTTENKLWEGKLELTEYLLKIKNIQQENFGIFVCTVKVNRVIVTSITYHVLKLTVPKAPQFPLLPGEDLDLACEVPPLKVPGLEKQKPKIHWQNPQDKKDNRNAATGGKLKGKVTNQDNGEWTCVVMTDEVVGMGKISVTVIDLAPAPSHPQYTSHQSPSLTIPCSFLSHITWEHIKARDVKGVYWDFSTSKGPTPERLFSVSLENKTWVEHTSRGLSPSPNLKNGELSLTKKRVTADDGGTYKCSIDFNDRRLIRTRTIQVQVLEIISSSGTELISGQHLNLNCSTGHALPSDIQLKLIPPQESSVQFQESDHHMAHITIPEVGLGDRGKWKCELRQNNTLLTTANITLNIKFKLSAWMVVTICGAAVIIILIGILTLILHRRRQWRLRHPRHRLCRCKNPKPKGFYRT